MYTIGIDIGGTHTDGVLLDATGSFIAGFKTLTTPCLCKGVENVIEKLIGQSKVSAEAIKRVIIGTTHATNAILEGKDLLKVGIIRLLDGKPVSPSPGFGWPSLIKQNVIGAMINCQGGYEFDGRASSTYQPQEIEDAIDCLFQAGAEALAVTGAFSPLNAGQEIETGCLIEKLAGNSFPYTLSHKIGGIGFIERENATILNSALKKVIAQGFADIFRVIERLGIKASLYMTENNGSLMTMDEAVAYPIKTIGAGPTNSFIGAARLCGLSDAIIVDIGGTSTDIGIVQSGYARSSLQAASIGGISLNFAMPDMLSLAIGGGSYVQLKDGGIKVGPLSAGKQINPLARIFGGQSLTLTDVAVAAGHLSIENAQMHDIGLSSKQALEISNEICQQIYQAITRFRGKYKSLPVIAVGGGAPLLKPLYNQFGLVGEIPARAGLANAYGAGLAEISAVLDVVVSLKQRENALNELKERAKLQAVAKGADPSTVRIACMSILPFAYSHDSLAKVIVTASGSVIRDL